MVTNRNPQNQRNSQGKNVLRGKNKIKQNFMCNCSIQQGKVRCTDVRSPRFHSLRFVCLAAHFPQVSSCLVAKLGLTLCSPMGYSPPGFSVHGISQARVLEWAASSSSRGSSRPREQMCISHIAGGFFTAEPPGKSYIFSKSRQRTRSGHLL